MEYLNADGTVMTVEQRTVLERNRRNKYLMLYVDSINAVRWASFSDEERANWVAYRQGLLNVPQQPGFPENITWPTPPN